MSDPRAHGDIEAVQRLCAHFGISTDYHDVWGNHHRVAREHLVGLLAEFDVMLDDTLDAAAALKAAQRADWSETLPPVLAIQAGAPEWSVALRLPATAQHILWRLEEEGGAVHSGAIDARSLPDTSYAELDGSGWYERRLTVSRRLPAGYHRFTIAGVMAGDTAPHGKTVTNVEPHLHATTLLISAPEHCHRPTALQGDGRIWGPAVQLYSLRSQHNWGIGDFGDLAQLVGIMAERGADIIGLSPLHALFAHNPAHASPYSPSSRQQINVLYVDVQAVDEFNACDVARRLVRSPGFQSRLAGLRATALVDYPAVAAAKFEVLGLLFAHFRAQHISADGKSASMDSRSTRGEAFFAFLEERGEALRRHALFEALQAHFHAADTSVWGWPAWPEAYRDPASPEVAAFAAEHADRVLYHLYLQWVAVEQLVRVNARCKALGLGIGLFLDLAVSVDRGGSDVWGEPSAFGAGASVGAPPDEFNPNGQSWGLPPLRPDHLRSSGYRIFIETLRANMRGAGALRIDHVMGLMRLFWVPDGRTARDGAYVHYALHEMMAIVALESQRNHCMVVGEDLGTVADEMRAALSRCEVHSYRLLYFERAANGDFKAASVYPRHALVAVSTHDLATLAGWWSSHDLRLRWQLGLFPDQPTFEKQLLDRAQERVRLLLAVQHAGLLTGEQVAEATGSPTLPPLAVQAVHSFLAMTPAALMLVQLEDALGSVEQANLPGTTDQQPNWRRKLPIDLDAVGAEGDARSLFDAMARLRPRASSGSAGAAVVHGVQTRVPRATYRLQFHKDFGFDDAVRILPYLAQLGVSHVYCSPIQRARAGSMHGYDVVAHDEVNPEIGGPEGFARFISALRQHGLGQLLDMVPNHMGVLCADNAWWLDVLENGEASHFAQHFDIDWQPLNIELTGKVLLPVLGGHYGEVLQNGEIALHFDAAEGSLALKYFEHRFPLAPESYTDVLLPASRQIEDADVAAGAASIASAFGHLPARTETEPQARDERARDKEMLKARLARLCARSPALTEAVAASVDRLNRDDARDQLHALIEAQAFRLAYWRVAADEINYRRFFDINDLAALRMERDEVFEATQSFALDLAAAGVVDGLRIDHPDGLYDPARYFLQLQQGYARRVRLTLPDVDAQGRPARPLYVVAEKIAAANEEVPESWHVHGTTGYRFANVANGVLVDAAAGPEVERIWRDFSGVDERFEALSHVGKRDVIRTALASELNVLATELVRLARADRSTRDYTLNALRRALAEVAVCLPVYRTYFVHSASEQDQHFIARAVEEARRESQDSDLSVFDFVHQSLLGEAVPLASSELQGRVRHFARRFQQFSAPVSAKGVEDTAFYRYFPLSSLNEVGGEPGIFGMTVPQFHVASADRALRWPHTMLATSTHDNKRSEDVRNRIDVLSEMPAAWQAALTRWSKMNQRVRDRFEAEGAPSESPSRADEYLLYQTLLGTLPAGGLDDETLAPYTERIVQYLLKAARESKSHTRWTSPNEAYEAALEGFVRGLLVRVQGNAFLQDLQAFGDTVAWLGAWNSLTLMLLKYASPGVPDLYQGNELMDLSLVDPDNRRPVDYDSRQRWLQQLDTASHQQGLADGVAALARAPHDGRAKLWVIWRLLTLRRKLPALFRDGSYAALGIDGDKAEHAMAFERRIDDDVLIVAAVRRFAGLTGTTGPDSGVPTLPGAEAWQGSALQMTGWPNGSAWENLLTGERLVVEQGVLQLTSLFDKFPGAALVPWAERGD